MALITYDNKVALNENASIPDINKVNASDMNQIKTGVNTNETNIGDLTNLNTTIKTNIVNAINEIVGQNVYSNTETIVGTWFNKPLYRKSFQGTGNLTNITSTGITNLDEVVDLKVNVKATSGGQWRTIPWIYNAGSYDSTYAGGAYVNSTGSTIGFQAGSALSATSKYNVTILYTKTS